MTQYHQRVQKLAKIVGQLLPEALTMLEAKKQEAEALNQHEDFLWHLLLSSAATLGRASGWDGLIGDEANYATVSYAALKALAPKEREQRLRIALRQAKAAYPDKKAKELSSNYQLIEVMGGLEKAKQLLFERQGQYGKLNFLEQFKGVGPKYARNIMMDIYHPEFRNVIAIDSRLQNILHALGFRDGEVLNYEHVEKFFLDTAAACGIDGWTLDRILFWFNKTALSQLES